MFLKSKGFLRNTGHWKRHGFETFSGFEKFEKRDNIARWSMRNRRATKVIFFKICAHYGKMHHWAHSGMWTAGWLAGRLAETPPPPPALLAGVAP